MLTQRMLVRNVVAFLRVIELRLIAFVCLSVLSACASQIMQGYVGKSITEVVLDYGPPSNIIELSEGKRAYQWAMDVSGGIPMTMPSTATVYGAGGVATAYGTSTTVIPYSQSCVYTLMATESGKDWIVDGYRTPTMGCE